MFKRVVEKWLVGLGGAVAMVALGQEEGAYLAPTALAASRDGKSLFVACGSGKCVLRVETQSGKVEGSGVRSKHLKMALKSLSLEIRSRVGGSNVKCLDLTLGLCLTLGSV